MSVNNKTSEYNELVSISQSLHAECRRDNEAWEGSPFAWIKMRPSRSIGAIGEKIVASWLAMHDFNVQRSPDSEADRVVEGKRIEIKFSTLWEAGQYVFQQIRNQNYEIIVFLGVSPNDAHCWVLPKLKVMELWHTGVICGQHTGQGGGDTAWVHLHPSNDNPYFAPYGNSLHEALNAISKLVGYVPRSISDTINE